MSGYRASALPARELALPVGANRGSLTIGTIAAVILALAIALLSEVGRGRVEVSCERSTTLQISCRLDRETDGIHAVDRFAADPEDSRATPDGSACPGARLPRCWRVTIAAGAYDFPMSRRYTATESEARAVAASLNHFFTTDDQPTVSVGYGPAPRSWWVVVPASTTAALLLASLVVRARHRTVLRIDANQRYVLVRQLRWPLRPREHHVHDDELVDVRVVGTDLVETELVFASGRVLSLFGTTVANRDVHVKAANRIVEFLRELKTS